MEKQILAMVAEDSASLQTLPSTTNKSALMYGIGVLAINIILEAFAGYAYFFYIEILGLAMTMAAVIKMVYAIWNSVNDPIFGFLSDNTRSRWGRRHAWLVPSMLINAVVFILIFAVPRTIQATTNLLFWYMLVILLLFETLTSILIVNYVALFPEYFHGLRQRSNASVYYHAGKIIGVLIGLTLTPLVYRAIGFSWMAVTYAILSVGLLALALLGNREDSGVQATEKVEFLPAFKSVLKDRSFWKFGITITLVLFGVNMVPFTLPFYVKHALNAGTELTSMLSAVALVASLLVLPLWGKIAQKWKMQTAFVSAMLIMSLGTLMISLALNSWMALVAMMVIGGAWGGIWVCNNIIRADLISQNLAKTEKHTEALYYGLLNVIQNMGGILQSVAMMLASLFFGYMSGEDPGPNPDMAFRFLMGWAPLVVLLISWLFARSFLKDYPEKVVV
ncbi:MAG TPA: MFS transporter [Anaerolineales bacterium]|nr:MFS transporter [Anaerolineales bacterium]